MPEIVTRLEGAAAVARYLGKPERWVYQARERGWRVPIRKADGIGIYAFADELDAWLRDPSTLSWSPKDARA
jgi:hypothetical protein